MQKATILRWSGVAAIAGGVLRIANTFTAHVFEPHMLALTYLLTDAFLLFGLIGWYASRAEKLGVCGVVGFVVAVIGILVIRSADLFPVYGYVVGAAVLLAGLAVMNTVTLLRRNGPILAPVLWLLSLVCALASVAVAALGIASAALFGAGFICAGIGLVRS